MKLSILDQSPVRAGGNAETAFQETIHLAQKAEEWGYHRFWVSEHHDTRSLAGSSPEVLLGSLGAHTQKIRLGTGGLLLPHYSPYKAAEIFHVLEALYPGRVDAGIGRAPGGMPRASLALSEGRPRNASRFPSQVDDLLRYMRFETIPEHVYGEAEALPFTSAVPPVWLLGTSKESAAHAAEKGLSYMYAHFIHPDAGMEAVKAYRGQTHQVESSFSAAVFVLCLDTEEEAQYEARSLDFGLLEAEKGNRGAGIRPPDYYDNERPGVYEQERIRDNRRRMIVGNPESVRRQLEAFAEKYGTDEIMIVTSVYDPEKRFRSFELTASLF
ncbi:LLM class flavin-dependent oxidoreductase [Alkalicoccus urumqiensis]